MDAIFTKKQLEEIIDSKVQNIQDLEEEINYLISRLETLKKLRNIKCIELSQRRKDLKYKRFK